jgi:hypothetical protein
LSTSCCFRRHRRGIRFERNGVPAGRETEETKGIRSSLCLVSFPNWTANCPTVKETEKKLDQRQRQSERSSLVSWSFYRRLTTREFDDEMKKETYSQASQIHAYRSHPIRKDRVSDRRSEWR